MGVFKARSDLKFTNEFSAAVVTYIESLDALERFVYESTPTGPNVYGASRPEDVARIQRLEMVYFANRRKLNSMINRASEITRERGIVSPYHALLVAPADYEKFLWRGSALTRDDRLEIMDALGQALPACQQHFKSEVKNFFNPFHHLANLVRFVLHPVASLFGTHFETIVKIITAPLSLVLIILVFKFFGVRFDAKDLFNFLKH